MGGVRREAMKRFKQRRMRVSYGPKSSDTQLQDSGEDFLPCEFFINSIELGQISNGRQETDIRILGFDKESFMFKTKAKQKLLKNLNSASKAKTDAEHRRGAMRRLPVDVLLLRLLHYLG